MVKTAFRATHRNYAQHYATDFTQQLLVGLKTLVSVIVAFENQKGPFYAERISARIGIRSSERAPIRSIDYNVATQC